jgi:hypothetical protein
MARCGLTACAAVGTLIFVIFGTQRDVLRVWARWLRISGGASGKHTDTRTSDGSTTRASAAGEVSTLHLAVQSPIYKAADAKAALVGGV